MHDKPRVDFKRFQTFGGIIAPLGHQVMPSDHRTVPYVNTGNSICISPVPTEKATEMQAVPVAAVDMSTPWASSTRVLGTDQLESDSFGFSLIADHKLSLSVRPTVDPVPHFFALGQTGVTDVGQVFHYDASGSNGLGILDKFLGSDVHQVGSDLGFIVSHPLQKSSGMLGSFRLNLGSGSANTSATVVQVSTREGKGFAVGGVGSGEYPFDARVNSDNAAFGSGLGESYFVAENEIPVFTLLAEFGVFPSLGRRNFSIGYLDRLAPEAESFLVGEGEVSFPNDGYDLSSEGHRMPSLLSSLRQECGSHTPEGRTGKLGREIEIFSDGIVVLGVKLQGMDLFGRMDNGGYPVTSGKVFVTESVKLCGLADLDFDCPDVHNNYLFSKSFENPSCDTKIVQQKEKWVRLPRH